MISVSSARAGKKDSPDKGNHNIDFEAGTILIEQQLKRDKGTKKYSIDKETKSHKSRTIRPAPSVMQLLQRHRKKQNEMRLRVGDLWDTEGIDDLVFTTSTGKHIGVNTLYHSVKRYATKIGVCNFTFHDLRHTFAVNYLLS